METCCECGGLGYIVVERTPLSERVRCEWCDGTGEVDDDDTA